MQRHFGVDNGAHPCRGDTNFAERVGFGSGKGISPGKVDQKQIVLAEIMAKRGFRQGTVRQTCHEIMLNIARPAGLALVPQKGEQCQIIEVGH